MYLIWKNGSLETELQLKQQMADVVKRSNERYMTMFDASFLGITLTDGQVHILLSNDKWAHLTNFSTDELTGMYIFDILTPESASSSKGLFKELRSGEVKAIDLEREYIRRTVSAFARLVYDSHP